MASNRGGELTTEGVIGLGTPRSRSTKGRAKQYFVLGTASALVLNSSTAGQDSTPASVANSSPTRGAVSTPYEGPIEGLPESHEPRRQGPAQADDLSVTRLQEAADRIQQAIEEQALQGFSGLAINRTADELVLRWKGELPPSMLNLIEELRTTVHVNVRPATYSLDELTAEAHRLAEEDNAVGDGGIIVKVGPLHDASGLRVVVDESNLQGARQSISSSLPLTFEVGSAPTSTVGRWDDISPFWGGGAIGDPDGDTFCSVAFSAFRTGSKGAREEFMITAHHCVEPNQDYVSGLTDTVVGTAAPFGSVGHDGHLLGGRDYDPFVYWGAWNSNFGVPVIGHALPTLGGVVHASGAFSGTHGAEITDLNFDLDVYDENGNFAFTLVNAFETNSAGDPWFIQHLGPGDSGGPVVSLNDAGNLVARGLIAAANFEPPAGGPCPNDPSFIPIPRDCSFIGYHASIRDVTGVLEVELQTAP